MVWFYKLPNSCIALLFGVIGAALFVGVLFLRAKLLRIQVQSDHAKAAHDALTVVIGFVGLILAFSLVQEQNNIRNLEAQIGTEANNLNQLDRLLVRFGTVPQGTIHSGYRCANMQTQLQRRSGENYAKPGRAGGLPGSSVNFHKTSLPLTLHLDARA
jgi:hypothetical protein